MKPNQAATLWLSTRDQPLRALLRAAFASQDITPLEFPPEDLLAGAARNGRADPPAGSLLLVDLAWAAADARGAAEIVRRARCLPWRPAVLAIAPLARTVWQNENEWARRLTGHDLLARPEDSQRETVSAFLSAAMPFAGSGEPELGRLYTHLRVLVGPARGDSAEATIRRGTGASPAELAAALAAGVKVADRRYRLKKYPECFVGGEAVDWLIGRYRVGRDDAVALGEALRRAGLLHHAVNEQPFRDGEFFYRVAVPGRFDAVPLDAALAFLRQAPGLVADRSWRGADFPQCLVGGEAVAALAAQFRLTRAEATLLGQSLADLGLLRHVADEHPFADDYLFYRIAAPRTPRPAAAAAADRPSLAV
ncbi:MAG: hypothetical protein CVU20_03435 [Betaproteobacteria bacterium HGW-Betaproteobacteria-14]|nr:MAG: hypothetical protein CVU20_03435 [Betaproteobacteria bacterium HGW-Betaproteobacteria-14]